MKNRKTTEKVEIGRYSICKLFQKRRLTRILVPVLSAPYGGAQFDCCLFLTSKKEILFYICRRSLIFSSLGHSRQLTGLRAFNSLEAINNRTCSWHTPVTQKGPRKFPNGINTSLIIHPGGSTTKSTNVFQRFCRSGRTISLLHKKRGRGLSLY